MNHPISPITKKDPNRNSPNKDLLRNSHSLPLKQLSRIVGNYTRRKTAKLIPRPTFSKIFEYPSPHNLSEIHKSEEELLNTLRASPPKAELSITEIEEDDSEELKKILREERLRYRILEQNYKELLDQFMQNEVKYKARIIELEQKLAAGDRAEFVQKSEFFKLSERVAAIEKALLGTEHS